MTSELTRSLFMTFLHIYKSLHLYNKRESNKSIFPISLKKKKKNIKTTKQVRMLFGVKWWSEKSVVKNYNKIIIIRRKKNVRERERKKNYRNVKHYEIRWMIACSNNCVQSVGIWILFLVILYLIFFLFIYILQKGISIKVLCYFFL